MYCKFFNVNSFLKNTNIKKFYLPVGILKFGTRFMK